MGGPDGFNSRTERNRREKNANACAGSSLSGRSWPYGDKRNILQSVPATAATMERQNEQRRPGIRRKQPIETMTR
jgi:hypothetical protein